MNPVEFIHDLKFSDIPASAVHQARRCLLDLAGVAASGRKTILSRIVHDFAFRQLGSREKGSRLLFDGRYASAAGAAYAGASTIDAFDAHDGHALTKGHAGVAILPAILAFADAEGQFSTDNFSMEELITLMVIGYEIATRAGIALHATTYDYHTSGAWNALGCAALGARILKLDHMQTCHALGTAEYHGPRSQMMRCIEHPTMLKDGSGWGAFAGVSAAYLARDGFTGAPAITVDGDTVGNIWSDLGSRWCIEEQYFKLYPVCRWAQPAIEAAATVLEAASILPSDIEWVQVSTFAHAVSLGTALPKSTEEAQYALGFPLAVYLHYRNINAHHIDKDGLLDENVASMIKRIRLVEDPSISALFPSQRFARVSIQTKAGTTHHSELVAAKGDPDSPLSDAELIAKFNRYTTHLTTDRAQSIKDFVMNPESAHQPASIYANLLLEA